jgi:hypothetical protein
MRADTLKLLNLELRLLEPWIAGGTVAEELAAGDGSVQVSVLATDRSRLLLITQHAPAQQFVLGPPPRSSVQITIPGASISDRAHRISLAGIKPLKLTHTSGGAHLTLDDASVATAVVITQDPLALHHLGRTLADVKAEAARLRQGLLTWRLARVTQIDGDLTAMHRTLFAPASATAGASSPTSADAPATLLREAAAHLDRAAKLAASGDFENHQAALDRCEAAVAKVRRAAWEATAATFPSPAASPCLAQYTSLPLHWQLAQRMQRGEFGPNQQQAGDMESLEQMLAVGWKQERRPPIGVKCDVSLSLADPHAGRSQLRLVAWAADKQLAPQVIEQPVVWITSSPVPVRQGQIVRIHAWVDVPRPLAGSDDGLVVFDSAGGWELGDRIRQTRGWREVTLYRAVPQNGELTVTLALGGLGEARIDDLAVSVLDPEPVRAP